MTRSSVVKDGERRSVSVDEKTHARIEKLKRVIGYEQELTLNQDDIVRLALDALEEKRNGNGDK